MTKLEQMCESKYSHYCSNKLELVARQVVDAWDLGEFSTRMDETITALREALAEQAEQELVCIDWDTKTDEPIIGYAAPVRTKDLTDDEISDVIHGEGSPLRLHDYAIRDFRAVIAADREKNK